MTLSSISATKANRLYWLGRYTERVYISLHLLRRYHDKMIDGHPKIYEEYYKKLDVYNPYSDIETFRMGYMYDSKNTASLLSGIIAANDNAIVLREEIMSETLSYIQLSLCALQTAAEKRISNITELQSVTDYLLAFWGSVDERVFDERVRNFLRVGKLVENIDMHIRFDYKFYRIQEAFESLRKCAQTEHGIFDSMILKQLDELLIQELYDRRETDYKRKILKYINHLVLL